MGSSARGRGEMAVYNEQHPQQGASTHRPRRLRMKRDPVEKAMPYDTALPLLQASASAEASEGASPHRLTQSGQWTVQPECARESVPVFAGTRHPQPAQSAGYLLERGLFRVCMVCSGSGLYGSGLVAPEPVVLSVLSVAHAAGAAPNNDTRLPQDAIAVVADRL